jgi:hypothetical protein
MPLCRGSRSQTSPDGNAVRRNLAETQANAVFRGVRPLFVHLSQHRGTLTPYPLNVREVARLLGGDALGRCVLCPGPGHSRTDRSLSVKLGDDAPEGFVVHSFAGDDPLACKDYVRGRLFPGRDWREHIPPNLPKRSAPIAVLDDDQASRVEGAMSIWDRAREISGTPAATYLRNRGLDVSEDLRHVLRFSGSLRLESKPVCGMVALMRDAISDVPCGLHRTFLHPDGRPIF